MKSQNKKSGGARIGAGRPIKNVIITSISVPALQLDAVNKLPGSKSHNYTIAMDQYLKTLPPVPGT